MYNVYAKSERIIRGSYKKFVELRRNGPFLFYNIFSLKYFHIKTLAHINEVENIMHAFYKHIIFLGLTLSMLMGILISVLYYAWNMLENA